MLNWFPDVSVIGNTITRALVVDDDDGIIGLLKTCLAARGLEVEAAEHRSHPPARGTTASARPGARSGGRRPGGLVASRLPARV
jgi:hypothetical protein